MDYRAAHDYITGRLKEELHPSLTYHCLDHTLDVTEATLRIAGSEKAGERETLLLLTAAVYHDSGMMVRYQDHETASAGLASETLPQFGYSADEIGEVNKLIMVTRLPQRPSTPSEMIICDADLDYLGRDDYFLRAFQLQYEWNRFGILKTDLKQWLRIQVGFLSDHHYFTRSASGQREETKQKHLAMLLGLCGK